MKNKLLYSIGLCLSLQLFSACKDYLEQAPLAAPATGQFFNNQTEMNAALTAVYKSAYWNTGTTPYQSIMDGWTDIALLRAPDMGEGNFDVFNANVKSIWTLAYTTIQRANTMIEGMETGKANVQAAAYNRLQAEERGLRAFAYFFLVNMYGDVPLITKPLLPAEFYTQLRSSKADVIKFMNEDLDAAAQVLDWAPADRGRMSKAVVLGIKARTAFYSKDYKTAAQVSKQIIDGAGLGLNPKFQDLFTKAGQAPNAGKEIMFEILYTDADANSITYLPLGSISRTAGGQSGRFPQQRLVDMFEAKDGKRIDESKVYDPKNPRLNRDMRLKYTVAIPGDTVTMNQVTFVYDIYKNTTSVKNADGTWSTKANADFDNAYGPSKSGVGLLHAKYTLTAENAFAARVNFILMRYAEVLLTYAESKIELNEIDASVISAINLVRKRAGQPEVEASVQNDQNKLRQLVRRERTVELAMEGFRWFDIRRWDIASVVMPQKIVGIAKDPGAGAASPDFKTTALNDLNNIPVYSDSEGARMLREIRFWYPKLNLLPVPQSERDINPKLTQNPEW
ncbi:RagB/SusD family nutrient uptake outer membrane protein [Dyadobacter subterraneus]|uniref:RagB/SusD family nutrient uptake outer membrane protein n=1 Tax=Dyadobacter subterraneus TaxID=2773304 RepID=A0ABR9WFT8_9BACT|nr:RagB/SusD family nutrient uptake outer membrane protein [Dyadobacter subterraneus]MBE9463786.1 RagB/SusD family nutrient uptake outer membrane protein [Dyadobacter subterraneus]